MVRNNNLHIYQDRYFGVDCFRFKKWSNTGGWISTKTSGEIIKDVNATMTKEGMPFTDFGGESIAKTIDGEITRDEAFALFDIRLDCLG